MCYCDYVNNKREYMERKNLHRRQILSVLDSSYFLPTLCVVGVIAMLIYSFGA